jgi:hypothetical protein
VSLPLAAGFFVALLRHKIRPVPPRLTKPSNRPNMESPFTTNKVIPFKEVQLSPHNDNQTHGPLQAIWRRIAYVTVEQLLREEFADSPHPLPDDASETISIGLRFAAKVYVLATIRCILMAGPGGITLPALIATLDRKALTCSAKIDESTDDRLVETIRQQFPTIFNRPLLVKVDDRPYEVSFVRGRFLARWVT